jgi:hypothetical protein
VPEDGLTGFGLLDSSSIKRFSSVNLHLQSTSSKPFLKQHLLKVNLDRDIREIACTVSTDFPPSTSFFHPLPHKPFFKRHLLMPFKKQLVR